MSECVCVCACECASVCEQRAPEGDGAEARAREEGAAVLHVGLRDLVEVRLAGGAGQAAVLLIVLSLEHVADLAALAACDRTGVRR